MDTYIVKDQKALRYGYTTGSCAAAAAKAATVMLLKEEVVSEVNLRVPKGVTLKLEVCEIERTKDSISCAVIKDGGDDPDATHGMKIYARVTKSAGHSILIDGGVGVGRVTKEGLKCEIGSAAINPVPRKMIEEAVSMVCQEAKYEQGLEVCIYAPEGIEVAKKTFNPRLGIVGGISILGTSGIVEPMSEAALIETIKIELNMQHTLGKKQILICPGNYGIDFVKDNLQLDLNQAVKYSNYLGETLDYISYLGFEKVLIIGHIGKLVKVAAGVMNTHSKYADARLEVLATHAALCGHSKDLIKNIMDSTTTEAALRLLKEQKDFESIMQSVMNKIKMHINFRVKGKVDVEILMFSSEFGTVAKSEKVDEWIKDYQMEGMK